MGSGSSSAGGESTIRYAEYIEVKHSEFLDKTVELRDAALDNNPYSGFSSIPVDVAFFGAGYTIASFPSLYDMYGKFMAGLNIEAVWTELFEDTVNGPQVGNLVATESAILQDELDSQVLPKFMAGMRDINAVMSSSFVIGKALLMDTKQKQIAKYSAELRYRLIPVAQDRYKTHLAWNTSVIDTYMNVMKHFFTIKQAIGSTNVEIDAKAALWDLDVLDYERANLGALQGAIKTSTKTSEDTGSGILGGALSGMAAGGMMSGGNPLGMLAGGLLGGLSGLL